MIRDLIILALVVGLTQAVRSFLPPDATVTGSGAALALGFLLLCSLHAGHLFHAIGLPKLTGYLLFGAAVGPQGLGLLTPTMLLDLGLVKKVSIGLIALLAGCELNLAALRPRAQQIGILTLATLAGSFLLPFGAMLAMTAWIPATADMPLSERLMVALVCANAACAFSPPVVMGILSETRARGPLTELWVSIVILADLLIVLLFSMTTSLAHRAFPGSAHPATIQGLVGHTLGSLGLGLVVGAALAVYAGRARDGLGMFVFAVLFVVAEAGVPLHIDPLLVGLSAGLFLENFAPLVRLGDVGGARVARATESAALPTFAVFFGVIGAEIHLDVFLAAAPFAIPLTMARAAGIGLGAWAGAIGAGLDARSRRLLPFGMLPQAGIAIALATAVKTSFHPWGEALGSLLLGSVVVNEIAGPVLFRAVVVRSGEAGLREETVDLAAVEQAPSEAG